MNDRERERLQEHGEEIGRGVIRLLSYGPAQSDNRQEKPLNSSSADIRRRKELVNKVQKALAKLQPAGNRLSLPEAERLTPEEVLRQNLLGLVDDDTLITDIIPQSDANSRHITIKADPLWQHISPLLTMPENRKVSTTFSVLKKFYSYIHADSVNGQARINALMKESLEPGQDATFETVGDLRRISLRGWNSIPGIGTPTANFMFKAFRKIEIPAD